MCRTARSFRTPSVSHGFFPLESFRRGCDAVLSFHMLRSFPASRYSWERTIRSSRERVTDAIRGHPVYTYMSVLCYCRTTRAHATRALKTATTLTCSFMPVYLCPMPLPAPLEMLDVACNPFLSLITARWVWQLHSLKLTLTVTRDTRLCIMHSVRLITYRRVRLWISNCIS